MRRPAFDAHPRSIHSAQPSFLAVSLRVPAHLRKEGALERIACVSLAAVANEGALVRVAVQPLVSWASVRPAFYIRRHILAEGGSTRQGGGSQISGGRHLAKRAPGREDEGSDAATLWT